MVIDENTLYVVSTHSRLKAAGYRHILNHIQTQVSTHSRLKAAGLTNLCNYLIFNVSTHSRLKAAGGMVGYYLS